MALPVNTIILVSILSKIHDQRVLLTHTLRVQTPATGTLTTDEELANLFDNMNTVNGLIPRYAAVLSNQQALIQCRIQPIYPVRLAYRQYVPTAAVGVIDAPAQATNVAADITLRTALAGRDQVATKHIGPVPDGYYVSGKIDAEYKTDLTALAAELTSDITPVGSGSAVYRPVIYHRKFPAVTTLSDDITNSFVPDTLRVMRRRTVGLGE